jgi:hypothetical protein
VKNINGSGRKAKSSGSERIRIRNTGFNVNGNPLENFVRGSEDTATFLKEFWQLLQMAYIYQRVSNSVPDP